MLTAGYLTIADLKAQVLPPGLAARSDQDAKLAKLGLGVAARFDRHIGGHLTREERTEERMGGPGIDWYFLSACPLETSGLTCLVVSAPGTASESASAVTPDSIDVAAGLIKVPGVSSSDALRTTYTGGYWLDDGDDAPAGSTPLPDDLMLAYLQQCTHEADLLDLFGGGATPKADDAAKLAALRRLEAGTLIASVRETLNGYVRFS